MADRGMRSPLGGPRTYRRVGPFALTSWRDLLGLPHVKVGVPAFRPWLNRGILRLLDDEALRRALAKNLVREMMRGGRG